MVLISEKEEITAFWKCELLSLYGWRGSIWMEEWNKAGGERANTAPIEDSFQSWEFVLFLQNAGCSCNFWFLQFAIREFTYIIMQ